MKPENHIAASLAGIPVYFLTGSMEFALWFSFAEVATDIDHVIDYVIINKNSFNPSAFLKQGTFAQEKYIVFLLHSYEFIAILAFLAFRFKCISLLGASTGMAFHLLLDEIGNRLPSASHRIKAPFYFFTYRLWHRFKVKCTTSAKSGHKAIKQESSALHKT